MITDDYLNDLLISINPHQELVVHLVNAMGQIVITKIAQNEFARLCDLDRKVGVNDHRKG